MRLMAVFASIMLLAPLVAHGSSQPLPAYTVVTEDFPPYNYQVENQPRGLSVDVLQAVFDELYKNKDQKLRPEIQFLPWARAYHKAQTVENVLIFSIARIPEREALFHWIGEIAPYRTSIYKLRRNPIEISSLRDAREYEVGVSQEDVIYSFLRSEGFERLDVIGSDLLNIQKLKHQRIPLIAYDEAAFHFAMEKVRDPEAFERVLRIEPLSGSLYMAFSQGSDPKLIQAFQAALAKIKSDGRYDKILERYFDQVNVGHSPAEGSAK